VALHAFNDSRVASSNRIVRGLATPARGEQEAEEDGEDGEE
jgi:hypothetical protein